MNKKKLKRKDKKIKQKQSQKQKQIVNVQINNLKPKGNGRKVSKRTVLSSPQFIFRVNEPPQQPNFNMAPTVAATPLLNAAAIQQQNAFQPIRNPLALMRMYPPPPIGKIPSYALRNNNPATNLDSLANIEKPQEEFFNSKEGAGGQLLSNIKMEPQSSPHVKFNNNITNTPAKSNEDEDYDFFFTPKNDENSNNNNFENNSTPPTFSPIPNVLMERQNPTNGRKQIYNQDSKRWVYADLKTGQNLQMNTINYNNNIAKNKNKISPKPFKF